MQFTGKCAKRFRVEKVGKKIVVQDKVETELEPKFLAQSKAGELFLIFKRKRQGEFLLLKGDEQKGLTFCSIDVATYRGDYYEIRFQQNNQHGVLMVPLSDKRKVSYDNLKGGSFQSLKMVEFEMK